MSKRLLLLLVLFFSLGVAHAQFSKGGFIAGGAIKGSYSTGKNYDGSNLNQKYKEYNLGFQPQVGYFIMDNLAVGIAVDWTIDDYSYSLFYYKTRNRSISVGPFVRYYYKKFFVSATGSLGGTNQYELYNGFTYSYKYKLQNLTPGIGYVLLLNEHVALEPAVLYSVNKLTSTVASSENTVSRSFLFSLGLKFYLHP